MPENQPQPFDESDVLFRFVPSEEEKGPDSEFWDVADEYAVEARPAAISRLCSYGRYGEKWRANPYERAIIARLLQDREAIILELKELAGFAESMKAERDLYRSELTSLKERGFTWDAAAILEQGDKIREGK